MVRKSINSTLKVAFSFAMGLTLMTTAVQAEEIALQKEAMSSDRTDREINRGGSHHRVKRIIRENMQKLSYMARNREIQFRDHYAQDDFRDVMYRFRRALELLENGNDGGDGDYFENYRGRTVAALHEIMGIWADKAINKLPQFVSRDDFAAAKHIAQKANQIFVADAFEGYFKNHSNQPRPRNHKARSAMEIIDRAGAMNLKKIYSTLPAFISADDYAVVSAIIRNNNPIFYEDKLKNYFQQ